MIQLVRRRQARRAGTHHRHLLSRPLRRTAAPHRPGGKGLLYDAQLVVPDGHGIAVHSADARLLAGRRADPPGELREIIGFQQAAQGMRGVPRMDHVVPLGNQIMQGTAKVPPLPPDAGLAEWDAAVHTPPSLFPAGIRRQGDAEGLPVPDPLQRRAVRLPPVIFQKSSDLSHIVTPPYPLAVA